MDRRNFLRASLLGAAAVAATPWEALSKPFADGTSNGVTGGKPHDTTPLRLSFQEGTAPGATLAERLDFMEQHGVTGLEPGGKNLAGRVNELQQLLRGRNISVSAICAGFSGFILSEKPEVRAEFDRSMREIIAAAGELGSTGVIMVPAFNAQVPVMPHNPETRAYLVEQLRQLGDYARECGTTVILEPLNRKEAHYLRQVADAASICRDSGSKGLCCMGDFWHMTAEETSDYGALWSAGRYLRHVHIASRKNRQTPGEDGDADNYTDGFRALKEMAYPYYVSFECGSRGDRAQSVPAALDLLREQWEKA